MRDSFISTARALRHPTIWAKPLAGWARRAFIEHAPVPRLSGADGPSGVVVSLTTFGRRLGTAHLAVLSMMHQSVKPDVVVLWLDKGTEPADVPASLRRLEPCGLDIRYGCEDIRGHKKYYWALREFADRCVITVDDDVIYPGDAVESLMRAHGEHPEAVVARRVNKMSFAEGRLRPYEQWEFQWSEGGRPRRDLLATGVGGILYPPKCFGEGAFDLAAIRRTSLGNDDIWLKAQELLCGREVAWAPCRKGFIHPYEIDGTQGDALYATNGAMGGNDAAIRAIEGELGLSFSALASGGCCDGTVGAGADGR